MEKSSAMVSNLRFLTTSIDSQLLAASIPRFSLSSFSLRSRRFYPPLRISALLPPPTSRRKPPAALRHERIDDTTTRVGEVDRSLAVKKKAVEISSELKGTSIFLVGIDNKLKTNVGKLIADALRYYYFDSDSLVEEAAGGESAAQTLRERDEEGFCESEAEVLKQLSSMGRLVVCAGDGAVRSPTNLALLRHGISIWIDVPLYIVAKGLEDHGSQVPVSAISRSGSYLKLLDQLVQQYEDMKGAYAMADATVSLQKVGCRLGYENDEMYAVTTEDMALEVLSEIQKLTRVKRMLEEAARPF